MHDDARTPPSRLPRGSRRNQGGSAGSTEQEKRRLVKRGLSRAQRALYQDLYRRAYVERQGGGEAGKAALRERQRQQKRSSRRVQYLPLLFETENGRYRLWTWRGPSKLFLKSPREAEGMRDLFNPRMRPTVVSYTTDVNRHLRSACKVAAAGVPIQALTHQECRAYAFLLWNECRGYHYLAALACDEDPLAADSNFRLVSLLLPVAIKQPLEFVRYLASRIWPSIDELVQEIEASEFPPDRRDPDDEAILHCHATLAAAHAYVASSGLSTSLAARPTDHRPWFRGQLRRTERTEPWLRGEPDEPPLPVVVDEPDLSSAPPIPASAPPVSKTLAAGKAAPSKGGGKSGRCGKGTAAPRGAVKG